MSGGGWAGPCSQCTKTSSLLGADRVPISQQNTHYFPSKKKGERDGEKRRAKEIEGV